MIRRDLEIARQSAGDQLLSLWRAPGTTLLAVLLPLNLLLLLSLFALAGYKAPTALVQSDREKLADDFVQALRDAHHSFNLKPMDAAAAQRALDRREVVAIVTVPENFSNDIINKSGPVQIGVAIDNVNVDVAEDVRRAIPTAAAIFAQRNGLNRIDVVPSLQNVLADDTGYVPYLGVSAVALAALLSGGVVGGMVVAREWEGGHARLMRSSPVGAWPVILGRLGAVWVLGMAATLVCAAVVVFGYGVAVQHWLEILPVLAGIVACAAALGGLLGALVRKSIIVAPLVVGLTLPFYLDSGALEPQRFDGETLFWGAHVAPTYYAVGAAEHAFLDLKVTPESWLLLLAALLVAAAAALALLRLVVGR